MTRIAFSWHGLPQYAARLIRGAVDRLGQDCVVVGSKPNVPIAGMEDALNCPVFWIDASRPTTWAQLGLEAPEIFVQSGWAYPAFNALGAEVKTRGGCIIGLSDNNWRGDFRQLAGRLGFRMRHRHRFDAMIVPGKQGVRLMQAFGFPADRVRTGMYGADPALFNGGDALERRSKTFLFVGQFIARKDVLGLARAFMRFSGTHPDWSLRICGGGEQGHLIPKHKNIVVEDFVQPAQLAERFRQTRFFVLPSLSEAWGLVVHEAASCGCALVLSNRIGCADDLAGPSNSVRFRAGNEAELANAMSRAAQFDTDALREAEASSRRLASSFGPDRFGREVAALVAELSQKKTYGRTRSPRDS